jgi:hypothetical protein
LLFNKTKNKRYYTNVGLWKTCGKLVENLWKTPVENFPAEISTGDFHRFGGVIHRISTALSTGFPQDCVPSESGGSRHHQSSV